MNMRTLAALGLAIGTVGTGLQGIGIAAEHYQLTVQIVALVCSGAAMFLQGFTKPVMGGGDKS